MFESSGNFTNHTFTTFLVNEEKSNIEFEDDYNTYINNIISFTDFHLKFDTNIKFFKKYLPQIQVNYYQSLHMYLHSKYITQDIIRFREIMDAVSFYSFRSTFPMRNMKRHISSTFTKTLGRITCIMIQNLSLISFLKNLQPLLQLSMITFYLNSYFSFSKTV